MKNKVINLVLFFVYLFIFELTDVNAGICEKKGHSYCNYDSGITFSSRGGMVSCENYCPGYFLRKGYNANVDGVNSLAFCLDPALSAPSGALTKVRSLDLSTSYDKRLYRMYQQYINELHTGGDLDYHNVYFEYALRVLTIAHGYHDISSIDKYANDGTVFIGCSELIDGSINSAKIIKDLSLNSELAKTYSNDNICFGGYKEQVKFYYNNKDETYLWKNPFDDNNITTTIEEPKAGDQYYRVKFNVNLTGFWEQSEKVVVGGGALNEASFSANISVNNKECKATGDCDATSYTGVSYITKSNQGAAIKNSYEFSIHFTPDQYKTVIDNGGIVSLNYSYNHPMNDENVFIARENVTKLAFQRMVVVKDFIHEDSFSISLEGKDIPEEELGNKCEYVSQGSYKDKNGTSITNFNDFLKNCGCSYINYGKLSESEKIVYNESDCSREVSEEKPDGEINSCTGSNYEDYTLKYSIKENLSKSNLYCVKTCVETIDIKNLAGRFTTKAGASFEFDTYPSLVATKNCTVDIDYDKFKEDYKGILGELVEAYNEWKEAETAVSIAGDGEPCRYLDPWSGAERNSKKYNYNGPYDGYKIVDNTRLEKETFHIDFDNDGDVNDNNVKCNDKLSWDKEKKKKKFQALSSQIDSINNLRNYLNQCNNVLFGLDAAKFYEFQQELNFYYEQNYSKDVYNKNNLVRNDKRGSLNAIDDSKFYVPSYSPSNVDNRLNYEEVIYSNFDADGNLENETIKHYNEDPYRTVTYEVWYERPKYCKYSSPLDAKVIGYEDCIDDDTTKKYNKLGYVYDIDVTAIEQNNDFYYSFKSLGDKNNKLFNAFKNSNEFGIKRECDYNITNEIFNTCERGICDSKLNILYRMVDPLKIDPNGRLDKDLGFKNWNNDKGKSIMAKIELDASSNSVFSPDNLEYSFDLDSMTIKEIRTKINEGNKYSDFIGYECDNGNECKGKFVSDYAVKNGTNQLIGNGRSSWKDWDKDESTSKCYIDSKEVPCS